MELILFIVVLAGIGFYFSVRRGRTTVRAAMYLMYMEEGYPVDDANNAIRGTDYADAAKHHAGIIQHASQPYEGSQLRMIAAARRQGFKE